MWLARLDSIMSERQHYILTFSRNKRCKEKTKTKKSSLRMLVQSFSQSQHNGEHCYMSLQNIFTLAVFPAVPRKALTEPLSSGDIVVIFSFLDTVQLRKTLTFNRTSRSATCFKVSRVLRRIDRVDWAKVITLSWLPTTAG